MLTHAGLNVKLRYAADAVGENYLMAYEPLSRFCGVGRSAFMNGTIAFVFRPFKEFGVVGLEMGFKKGGVYLVMVPRYTPVACVYGATDSAAFDEDEDDETMAMMTGEPQEVEASTGPRSKKKKKKNKQNNGSGSSDASDMSEEEEEEDNKDDDSNNDNINNKPPSTTAAVISTATMAETTTLIPTTTGNAGATATVVATITVTTAVTMTTPPSVTGTSTGSEETDGMPLASPDASPLATPDADGGDGDDDNNVCFPASATVTLDDGTTVEMGKLRVGDRVVVGGGHSGNGKGKKTSMVYGFSHSERNVPYEFVEVKTECMGINIRATKGHYIPVIIDGTFDNDDDDDKYIGIGIEIDNVYNVTRSDDGQQRHQDMLRMRDIKVGHFLRVVPPYTDVQEEGEDERLCRVNAVRTVVDIGLFNPHTDSGTIVVDGVVATTWTTAIDSMMAHALLTPIRSAVQMGMRVAGRFKWECKMDWDLVSVVLDGNGGVVRRMTQLM